MKGYRNLALINLDNESSKEPNYVGATEDSNLDGNKGLQSSNLNYVVLQKID